MWEAHFFVIIEKSTLCQTLLKEVQVFRLEQFTLVHKHTCDTKENSSYNSTPRSNFSAEQSTNFFLFFSLSFLSAHRFLSDKNNQYTVRLMLFHINFMKTVNQDAKLSTSERMLTSEVPALLLYFIYFFTLLFEFLQLYSNVKFGLLSTGIASCDRVALPNLRCMLVVLVLP